MRPENIHPGADILIVDDTPANLHLLAGMLKERGHRVRPVPDGQLALQAAHREPPGLVLLDINMPDLDGYQVCKELKSDPRLADIPVIFISANTDVLDKVKAFSLGGVDYVTKPFQFEEVHARVAAHLEIRRQRRALQESRDRLAKLESLRDGLVHMLVHDMRSPLAALIGSLSLVKDDLAGKVGDESAGDVEIALASANRLSQMANDILDVSRMEQGAMPLCHGEYDLDRAIDKAVENVRGMNESAEVRIEAPGPLRVRGDEQVIRRVLENLVSNGLKHTPSGGTLHVSARATDGGVRVVVRDEGPGIPALHREKIFEKFGVLEARRELGYHSVGLGLTFCKLAVETHGGRIGIEAEDGEGGRFWFWLPRDAGASQ